MNIFNNELSTLLDNGRNQFYDFFGKLEERFDEFDEKAALDALVKTKDSFLTHSGLFFNDLNKIFKNIKNGKKSFRIEVKCDQDKDNLSYKVEDSKDGRKELTVYIESNDGLLKQIRLFTIPKDCDVEKLSTIYNEEKNAMIFTIPKKKKERKNIIDDKFSKRYKYK